MQCMFYTNTPCKAHFSNRNCTIAIELLLLLTIFGTIAIDIAIAKDTSRLLLLLLLLLRGLSHNYCYCQPYFRKAKVTSFLDRPLFSLSEITNHSHPIFPQSFDVAGENCVSSDGHGSVLDPTGKLGQRRQTCKYTMTFLNMVYFRVCW